MDVDLASQSIDALIDRRGRDEANAEESLWAASDRKHRAEQQRELKEAWACYHQHMNQLHAAIAQEHADKAEALCDEQRE